MNTTKNEKKKWETPLVFDLDVKKTKSGTSTFITESDSTWTSVTFLFAPASS